MDRITIKNLEIFAHHGVMPEENVLGQKFLVSVDMYMDLKAAGRMDDLCSTINYAEVCHEITKLVSQERYKLIEAVGERIIQMLFSRYPQIEKAEVTIDKPWAPILLSLEHVSVTLSRSWHRAFLGLGSNMGDKKGHLEEAIALLEKDEMTKVEKISSFYETAPVGEVEQDDFLNGAVQIKTLRTPEELLSLVAQVEKEGKRERVIHWGPRTIDVDILLYDNLVVNEENLQIPHPEMTKRGFVLEPLTEIAPYALHSLTGKRIAELWQELKG